MRFVAFAEKDVSHRRFAFLTVGRECRKLLQGKSFKNEKAAEQVYNCHGLILRRPRAPVKPAHGGVHRAPSCAIPCGEVSD